MNGFKLIKEDFNQILQKEGTKSKKKIFDIKVERRGSASENYKNFEKIIKLMNQKSIDEKPNFVYMYNLEISSIIQGYQCFDVVTLLFCPKSQNFYVLSQITKAMFQSIK